MLPAFTGALLGATAIRPGRPNVWGTLLAVAVLAVAVAGLTQLGAPFFVENLFNGAMLVLAVGLAVAHAIGGASAAAPAPRRGASDEHRAFDCSGQRILITGAAAGIGAAPPASAPRSAPSWRWSISPTPETSRRDRRRRAGTASCFRADVADRAAIERSGRSSAASTGWCSAPRSARGRRLARRRLGRQLRPGDGRQSAGPDPLRPRVAARHDRAASWPHRAGRLARRPHGRADRRAALCRVEGRAARAGQMAGQEGRPAQRAGQRRRAGLGRDAR